MLGRPRWVWKAALLEELLYRINRLRGDPEVWLRHLGRAAQAQGILMGEYAEERAEGEEP